MQNLPAKRALQEKIVRRLPVLEEAKVLNSLDVYCFA